MTRSFINFLENLDVTAVPVDSRADYAYALECCKFPASVVCDDTHQHIANLCDMLIQQLGSDLGEMSEIFRHHSESQSWYAMRRKRKMEVFTRTYQWRIVNELLSRKDDNTLGQILLIAESLEAAIYASILNLPYTFGKRLIPFKPSRYKNDGMFIDRIKLLSKKATLIAREELIEIADYIQTEIVEKGETANHMELVNAILSTGMPYFNYPKIVSDFESVTKSLAKTKEMTDIELAPYFYNLWDLTQKPTYLSRFEKTVRRCYLTLAANKHYPDLGVNTEDSDSLASALKFLDDYRINVWILNEKYDVDKVIAKYKTA